MEDRKTEKSNKEPERGKPGPVAGPPTRKYTLLLDKELGEWGKRQAGGLSELVRDLLRRERERSK